MTWARSTRRSGRRGNAPNPVCIAARTVIGKGVPFMEGKAEYHGKALNRKEMAEAAAALGIEDRTDYYRERRKGVWEWRPEAESPEAAAIETGVPFTYADEDKIDNRTAFGKALKDIGEKNIPLGRPVCALDCDLASSVKSAEFARAFPDHFFQGGVQEHNTATVGGALSTMGILTFFADFGAFGMDETYNQQRLNDINRTNLKLVLTHLGLDVGEDGKTHQCIDYIGLARNLYRFKPIVPADPNQTDRVVRYAAGDERKFHDRHGQVAVAGGPGGRRRLVLQQRLPVCLRADGRHPRGHGRRHYRVRGDGRQGDKDKGRPSSDAKIASR